jgi:chemotaxis signal transduction protein
MTAGGGRRWMLCQCRSERFALDLRHIREIIYRPQLVVPPGLEPPLCGMVVWQGRTRSVLSLRSLAGDRTGPDRPVIVVISDGRQEAGLLVDGIGETVIDPALFPLHPALLRERSYLAQGFTADGAVAYVLEVPELLARFASQTAGAAAAAHQPPVAPAE